MNIFYKLQSSTPSQVNSKVQVQLQSKVMSKCNQCKSSQVKSSQTQSSASKLMRSTKHNISSQGNHHNHPPIRHQRQTELPEKSLSPQSRRPMTTQKRSRRRRTAIIWHVGFGSRRSSGNVQVRLVVILFKQPLVGGRVRRRDFIIKQTRENKTNASTSRAAHIRQHRVQRRHRHSGDIAQD